jgi:hypothetical protein
MTGSRRDGAASFLAATVIVAVLVHFVVVLLAPYVASRDAFTRLAPLGALNDTVLMQRGSPAEKVFPYAGGTLLFLDLISHTQGPRILRADRQSRDPRRRRGRARNAG